MRYGSPPIGIHIGVLGAHTEVSAGAHSTGVFPHALTQPEGFGINEGPAKIHSQDNPFRNRESGPSPVLNSDGSFSSKYESRIMEQR